MAQLNVSISHSSNASITFQNYYGDPWNSFDFVIVLGSYIDIIYSELNVSPEASSQSQSINSTFPFFVTFYIYQIALISHFNWTPKSAIIILPGKDQSHKGFIKDMTPNCDSQNYTPHSTIHFYNHQSQNQQ